VKRPRPCYVDEGATPPPVGGTPSLVPAESASCPSAPFTLALPYADLFWTGVLSVVIGLVMSSAFSAIVVFAQELVPGKVGMIAGIFFGLMFGVSGIGAAAMGHIADVAGIEQVYRIASFLPLLGILAALLPKMEARK